MTATPSGCQGMTPPVGSSPPAGEEGRALGGLDLQAGQRELGHDLGPAQLEVRLRHDQDSVVLVHARLRLGEGLQGLSDSL
eukprot:9819341-Alexandrium_andersonii.AAC.1